MEADGTIVRVDAYFERQRTGASQYVVRLALDKDTMRTRDITPPYLHHLIEQRLGVAAHVVSSETNCLDWVLRLRYHDVSDMMARLHGDAGGDAADVESTLVLRITTTLLDQIVVGGHVGVTEAYEREVECWNANKACNETVYVVAVMGNVLNSAALFPVVDAHRSYSNDPHEVAACLGIEATMATIHHECDAVISFDSTKVDARHIALLADAMTYRGKITAMSRHGINRPDSTASATTRASFEESIDTLVDAAMYAESDPAAGVSFSVMAGEESCIVGTGCFDVLMPEQCVRTVSAVPARRIARSTVGPARPTQVSANSVGYVDKTLWDFDSTAVRTDDIHRPFFDGEALRNGDEAAPATRDGRVEYDHARSMECSSRVYVPSSPRLV